MAKTKKKTCYEKKIFGKILKKLLSFYGKGLKGHAMRRIKSLTAFICGILRKKKPHMSALGSGLPQIITAHSKEKAAKKFLENHFIDFDDFIGGINCRTPAKT